MPDRPTCEEPSEAVKVLSQQLEASRQRERALEQSQSYYRDFFEYGTDGIVVLEPDTGRLVDFNDQACRQLGYTREEFARLRLTDIAAKETAEEAKAHIQKILKHGRDEFETLQRTRSGEIRHVHVTAQMIGETEHAVYHCIWRDITDRKKIEMALRESEQRYRRLAENSPDMIYRMSLPDGRYEYVSPAAANLFGHPPQAWYDNPVLIREIIHPDWHGYFKKQWENLLKGHIPPTYEYQIIHKDKGVRWINQRNILVKGHWGRPVAIEGVATDITERKQTEAALQARESFLNRVIDQSPFATWISDATGTLQQANPALKKILNLTDDQLVGKYNILQDPLVARQGLMPLVQSVYEKGETIHFACEWNGNDIPTLNLKDSNAVSIEATMFPILGPQGEVTHAVVNWIDITERRRAREALRASEQRFKAYLEANPDPVVVYDIQGHPLFLNPAFTEVFGWSLDELREQRIPFVPEDQKELARTAIEDLYRSGKAVRFQSKRLTRQGGTIDVIISAAIIKGDRGKASGMVVNLTDVSEQRKLESQLQQAQKLESIGRLAGGVAHDFNNMLSIIHGNAEMVLEDSDPANPIIANVQEIQKAAARSADLTRQLLAFARKQTIAPKILDLNKAIEGMLNMLRRLIGEDIDLSWQPKKDLWSVKLDPSQVDQVLANLCVNARDSIRGIGRVSIETDNVAFDEEYCLDHKGFHPGDYVMTAVSDNGRGMDKETLANLFEPFFTTKGIGKGTGLGLSTVYGIVRQNNGFINVYSEPGQGTTFKIFLPRAESAGPGSPQGRKEAAARGWETVLLVEDEKAILKMTAIMLQRLGYTVLSASSPNEAMALAESESGDIHLLMTDVVMPEMSGRDLAENLLRSFPHLKCLFMSGYTANVIAHHGILDEGIEFINKPFSKQALAAKVRNVLGKAKGRS